MIEDLFTLLYDAMTGNFWLAITASFAWGVLSILLSPCHLSSIPLIIGFINSYENITAKKAFKISLVFSIGILVTIAVIGLITAAMGRLLGDIGTTGNYLVAIIFLIVGLYLLDVIKLPMNGSFFSGTRQKGYLAAFILGLLFGIGLGPCTFAYMAPVLGVVFETAQTNFLTAVILLSAFALGHCSVITIAGTVTTKLQKYLNWTEKSKAALWIKRICGVLVILGGVYLIFK